MAVSLRELVILDENQILTILNDINEENAFIRMGYADINGNARMVDMEGNVEEVNLKGMDFLSGLYRAKKHIQHICRPTGCQRIYKLFWRQNQ